MVSRLVFNMIPSGMSSDLVRTRKRRKKTHNEIDAQLENAERL